jgi:hypothetical protein
MKYRRLVFTSAVVIAVLVGMGFLLPALAQQKELAAKAQNKGNVGVKLEYKVVDYNTFGTTVDELENSLNKLGGDGWDCAGTVPLTNAKGLMYGFRAILKRPKALP